MSQAHIKQAGICQNTPSYRRLPIILLAISLIALLAACGGGDDNTNNDPSTQSEEGGVIQWNRDPLAVVFRTEVIGGTDADDLSALSEVPLCTIYGDNRLVWVVDNGSVQQILFDQLTDTQVSGFIASLTVDKRIYTYGDGFSQLLPSNEIPVYERILVNVNGRDHITDEFAGWPNDEDYFETILQECIDLATTPRIFVPEGAWISAREVEYTGDTPEIIWEPDAAGLYLTEIAGEGELRWIEGNNVSILWNVLYNNNLKAQFNERGVNLRIALQVPGVTRDAPAAPQE